VGALTARETISEPMGLEASSPASPAWSPMASAPDWPQNLTSLSSSLKAVFHIISNFVGSCVGSSLVTISDEEIDIALRHLAVGEMANHPCG